MSTLKIITLILTSSFLSAGLTAAVNWYIQKNNYRNDYYKKILDKRISAYEQVHRLLSLLSGTVQLADGRICLYQLALGQIQFGKFLTEIFVTIEQSFWLSEQTGDLLKELNLFFLNNIDNEIDENGNYDQQLIEVGIKNIEQIRQLRFTLQRQLYIDLSSLHEINKFMKPKSKGKDYQVYGKPTSFQKRKGNDTTNDQKNNL